MLPFQIEGPEGSPNARSVASRSEASVETLDQARTRILALFRTLLTRDKRIADAPGVNCVIEVF